jgi:DNA-binding Lrp family transcriptional regulator
MRAKVLSEQVNLSASATLNWVHRLEAEELIEGYRALRLSGATLVP